MADACLNTAALARKVQFIRADSESSPHEAAMYLRELLMFLDHVLTDSPATDRTHGLSAFTTILVERADTLTQLLAAPAFDRYWPELETRLATDPTLGLEGR